MRLFFTSLFLALSLLAFSQKTIQQDVVYLKNGNIIKGKIIEEKDNEYLKIEILGGTMFIFQTAEVEKIVRDEATELPSYLKYRKPFRIKEKGIYHASYFGPNWSEDGAGYNFTHSSGYQFNRYIGVGGGLSIDVYDNWDGEVAFPLFAEARGYLMETPTSLFYSMAVGYGFVRKPNNSWWNPVVKAKGGLMLKPTIGLQFPSRGRAAFIMDYGYQFQWAKYERIDFTDNYRYQRMTLRVGVLW